MDENTKDVAIAAVGVLGAVLGTLGGIALGSWIEGRRRFEPDRLAAYRALLEVCEEYLEAIRVAGDNRGRLQAPKSWYERLRVAGAGVQMLAPAAVAKTAAELTSALADLVSADDYEQATAAVFAARKAFIREARKDVGLRG